MSDVKEDIPSLLMFDSTAAQPEIVSGTNGEESAGPAEAYIVSDTNIQEHHQKMSDSKSGTAGKASDRNGAARETTVPPPAMPPFDTTKYVLGTLCPRGHEYHGTGKTLLHLPKRRFLPCENEKKRENLQAQLA